jgi:two-component system, cell cycle sensor histidine kinase and response regulator CckA
MVNDTANHPMLGASVLVVDDDEDVRGLVHDILESRGYGVTEAADGEQALELCANPGVHVDLVLSDVMMPGVGGMELAQRLAATRPGIKVLLMSGCVPGPVADWIAQTATQCLPKPFVPSALVRTIEGALATQYV